MSGSSEQDLEDRRSVYDPLSVIDAPLGSDWDGADDLDEDDLLWAEDRAAPDSQGL